MLIKDEDVIGFERSFHVYYFDMIYSNPAIVEIDVLLMLRGGLVAIEEEKGEPGEGDILKIIGKQFDKGEGGLPIFYSPEGRNVANLKVTNIYPFDREEINRILNKTKEFEVKEEERAEVFSLDNFLCALLLFGAPAVIQSLVGWIEKNFGNFKLIKRRCEVLREVKQI